MSAPTAERAQKPLTNPYLSSPSSQRTGARDWLGHQENRWGDSLADLKASVDFGAVVAETHDVNRSNKALCPAHDDHNPSCHIYADGFKCYSCGAHGDVITWLEHVHGISTADAIRLLRQRVGGSYSAPSASRRAAAPKAPTEAVYKPVEADALAAHKERAEHLRRGPKALSGRGFTLADLRRLGIAADDEDAILPITGPTGVVLALKRRYAVARGKMRYIYDTPGHGTPAWCSPGFWGAAEALVIEGELNGMACWLARPELGVMGAAGTSGGIYTDALQGKTVYVYGDGDDVGVEARTKWADQAVKAGAAQVYVLEPWEMDACDIAGRLGRNELARRLA